MRRFYTKLKLGIMDYLETTKRFMFALNVRNISVYNRQTSTPVVYGK
jgi:hypothetical protein